MGKKKQEPKQINYEDLAFKSAAQFFAEELFPIFGIDGEIEGVAPTEVVRLELRHMYQDFNFWMKGNYIVHIEFQTTWSGEKDLRRFREYEATTSRVYDVNVKTYVVFTGNITNPKTSMDVGNNIYRIKPIILKKENADEIIQKIKEKKNRGENPDREELVSLMLMPLMGGKSSKLQRILYSYQAMKEAEQEPEQADSQELTKMQAILYTFASKLLRREELEKVKEAIGMTELGQMLVDDGIKIGEKRGEIRGEKRGIKRGEKKGKVESILEILSTYGDPGTELKQRIKKEDDLETLSQWVKTAVRAGSIEAFEEQIK